MWVPCATARRSIRTVKVALECGLKAPEVGVPFTQDAVDDNIRHSIGSDVTFVIVTSRSALLEKTSELVEREKVGDGGPLGPALQDARASPRMNRSVAGA